MALPLSLLLVLVVVSCGPRGSVGCDLPQSHIQFNRDSLVLLNGMWKTSNSTCLKDTKNFSFPQAMVNGSQGQKAQAISVLHETLQHIFALLLRENTSAAWNTTLLNQLRMGLYRQLEDLEPCLVREMGEEGTAPPPQGRTWALKRYFRDIFLYLEKKKYSECAWQVVRVAIMKSLSSIITLQESLSNMDGDLRSP